MIRKLLFSLLLMFTALAQLNAQEKSKLADCRTYFVQDSDKRDFSRRDSFALDVDGDGRADTVTTRIYAVKTNRRTSGKTAPQPRETHWIAFDLKTGAGRVINPFFKYKYGTNEADYYVYAIVPCNFNRDGKTDFLFYAGDDESDETLVLVNNGNRFRVYARKTEQVR